MSVPTTTVMKLLQKRVLYSLALVALATSYPPVDARQRYADKMSRNSQRRAENPPTQPPAILKRSKAMEQIHAFVDKAQSLQDITLKVDSLIALAAALWKDGGDAVYARQIFIDTHNFLKTFQPQEVKDTTTGTAPAKGSSSLPPSRKTLRLLRRRLVTTLAKFDLPLANRLAKEQDGYFDAPLEADEFKERTREQVARQDFDKFSNAQHVGRNEAMILLSILDEFRKKDVKTGDELFLAALTRLRTQQNVEANTLLILGNYFFSGYPLPSNESSNRLMVSPVQVGGVPLAADLVLNRDNFSKSLVPLYLTTAVEVLSRQVEDVGEQRRYSAAALLLVPKAKEFAPNLVATFAALAQRSDPGFMAAAAGQGGVKRWANEKIDLESALSQIRKTAGTKEHDRLCLTMASQYSAQKDLDAAMRVAEEITDAVTRGKLLSILNYKQASNYLKDGDLARAEETGARMSSETVRALFYLSLSATHFRGGRADLAKIAAGNAIGDARKSDDLPRRPFLLMMAAAALSKNDAAYSLQLFREALDELDGSGYSGRQPHIIDFGWVETVSAGGQSVRFELQPGLGLNSYPELLKHLFVTDRRSMVTAVSGLKTEALLSSHLVAASQILLETTRKESPKSETR